MTQHSYVRLAVLAVVVCSSAVVLPAAHSRSRAEGSAFLRSDALRVQAHLRRVEAELRARDVSSLTPKQLAARGRNIEVLNNYIENRVFPHNHGYIGKRVPYFRDAHGTLCAVAYLMAESGRMDLVNRIARTNNNVYVKDLAGDRDVAAWLDANGLTLAEAARIQPTYGGIDEEKHVSTEYAVGSALLAAADVGVVVFGIVEKNRSSLEPGVMAMGFGAGTFLLGLSAIGSDNEGLTGLNCGLGAATFTVGLARTVVAIHARVSGAAPANKQHESRQQGWSPTLSTGLGGRTKVGLTRRF